MKNKYFKNFALLLLAALLLASLFTFTASAEAEYDEDGNLRWTLFEDGDYITNGEKKFYYYSYDTSRIIDQLYAYYYFENTVYIPWLDCEATVGSYSLDGEIIWLYPDEYDYIYIYMTYKGKQYFDDILARKNAVYHLNTGDNFYYEISDETVEKMVDADAGSSGKLKINLNKLKNYERYDLYAHDEPTKTISYVLGTVYLINGSIYYLHTVDLPNSYFDADGFLSYRSGEVEITKLDANTAGKIESALENRKNYSPYHLYESEERESGLFDDDKHGNNNENYSFGLVAFWFCFAIVGLILPIPFVIVGTIFAKTRAKYWYSVTYVAALWMLLAIILMVLLLTI